MPRKRKSEEPAAEAPVNIAPETMPGRNGGTLKRGGSAGRPPGSKNLTTLLREFLQQNEGEVAMQVVRATVLQAAKGNGAALKILWERSDGLMKQQIDLTNNGGAFEGPTIYLPSNGRDGEPSSGGTE